MQCLLNPSLQIAALENNDDDDNDKEEEDSYIGNSDSTTQIKPTESSADDKMVKIR